MKSPVLLVLIVLAVFSTQAHAIGFQRLLIADPDDQPIEAGVWYPSSAPTPDAINTPFRQALAFDSAVDGKSLPLVVLSHGYGGWLGGHAGLALALAEAGYVVVAPTHTGNNYEDESYPASRWMRDRPRHVARVIDHMLTKWPGHGRIDGARIGTFGFSAGGYTALVVAGAVPNIAKLLSHCKRVDEVACRLDIADDTALQDLVNAVPEVWVHDPRIKTAVVVAPGFGFAFDAAALEKVTMPIQLWAASEDRNVPYESNTQVVLESLPHRPEFQLIEGAGHFAFLPPCNPLLEQANPRVWKMICIDSPSFDRAAFHVEFNRDVISFFDRM